MRSHLAWLDRFSYEHKLTIQSTSSREALRLLGKQNYLRREQTFSVLAYVISISNAHLPGKHPGEVDLTVYKPRKQQE
jgi:hypothetical protein